MRPLSLAIVALLLSTSASAESIDALTRRAEALYTRKDYRAGLKASLAIIVRSDANNTQRARAFLYIGVFYTELGRHPQAINSFLELLRYRPKFRLPPRVKGARPSYPKVQQNFRAALAAFARKGAPAAARKGTLVAAVFSIDMKGVPRARRLRTRLNRYLHAQLAAGGRYRLVATSRMASALRSLRKRSYRPCYARSCQVAIGQQLAAQAAINTMLFRIGRKCFGTITLYDLKSGTTRRAATAEGSCSGRGLLGIVRQLASRLGR